MCEPRLNELQDQLVGYMYSCSQSSSRLLAIINLFLLRLFDSIEVAALTLTATVLAIISPDRFLFQFSTVK
jgi:hypothetical protein